MGARQVAGRRAGALRRALGARVAAWVAAAERVGRDDFTWVEDCEEIPPAARADSWLWCARLFAPEVSPHNEALQVRRGVHVATRATLDLIRHEYAAQGIELVVTEGRNFVLVQLPRASPGIRALPRRQRRAAVRRLAATLFGAARVEGGFWRGQLCFMRSKKLAQRVGFLNGRQWFDDEARRRCARR